MGRPAGAGGSAKARPSSSSQAAMLLQAPGNVNIGFGGYLGNSRVDEASLSEESYLNVDGESAANLRRLSKKDATTKLKALTALRASFQERSSAELSTMLPCWVFQYRKLVLDNSRQIREATQKAMAILASKVGKSLAPHLKSLMGPWWLSHFDPYPEVAEAAKQAFQTIFPEQKKRVEALAFCASDVLIYFDDNLRLTPQTVSDSSTPLDESTEKHERIISSTLLALAALMDVLLSPLSSDQMKDIASKQSAIKSSGIKIFQDYKQFQGFVKASSPRIRAAAYRSIKIYIEKLPDVVSTEAVAKVILGTFGEKDPSCHQSMWDMILRFSKACDFSWEAATPRKAIFPRLWAFLRHGCYGSQRLSYPCLVPLLSLIPPHVLAPAQGFFDEFFSSLWAGCSEGMWSYEDGMLLLQAVRECFDWVLANLQRYAHSETEMLSLQASLVELVLLRLLWASYVGIEIQDRKSSLLRSNEFMDSVASQASCILDNLDDSLLPFFWEPLRRECILLLNGTTADDLSVLRMAKFLTYLNKSKCEDVLEMVVRPFVMEAYSSIKTMERPHLLKLLSQLVDTYGPSAFSSLASSNWKGMGPGVHGETENLTTTFALNHLDHFFQTEIIPWCLNDPIDEAKLDLLLSFLEDERLFRRWDSILHDCGNRSDLLAALIRKIKESCLSKQSAAALCRWKSPVIDALVVKCLDNLADSPSYSLVRNCMEGIFCDETCFVIVSSETVKTSQRKILTAIISPVASSTTSLFSLFDPTGDNIDSGTYRSAHLALELFLPSYPMARTFPEIFVEVLAAVLWLRWMFMPPYEEDTESHDDIELQVPVYASGEDAKTDFVNSLSKLYRELPTMCKDCSEACRSNLQNLLITALRERLSEAQESGLEDAVASRFLELLKLSCSTPSEVQAALDLFLAPNEYWPIYAASGANCCTGPMKQHETFCATVYKIGTKLGLGTLILGGSDDEKSRPWLVIELLCSWDLRGGSVILPFLQSSAKTQGGGLLVDDVLDNLVSLSTSVADASKLPLYSCWRSTLDRLEAPVRSLLVLLEAISGDEATPSENFFHKHVETPNLPLCILPCVLEILTRKKLRVELEPVVACWLETALQASSLVSLDADTLVWLQVAVACFPVDYNGGPTALLWASAASSLHAGMLLLLLRKQYKAIDSGELGASEPLKQLTLARLTSAAVCYCWGDFEVEDWRSILLLARKWLQKGVVKAEEFTEAIEAEEETEGSDDILEEILANTLVMLSMLKALKSIDKAIESSTLDKLAEAQWQSYENRATDDVLRLLLATGLAEALSSASKRDEISSRRLQWHHLWDHVATIALDAPSRARDAAIRAANLWGLKKSAVGGLYALLFSPHPLPSLQWVSYNFLSTDPLQHQAITWNPASPATLEESEDVVSVSDDLRPELRSVLDSPAELLASSSSSRSRVHFFLAWSLFLTHLQSLETSTQAKDRLLEFTQDSNAPGTLLDCLFQHIPLKRITGPARKKDVPEASAVTAAAQRAIMTSSVSFAVESLWGGGKTEVDILAGALYGFLLRALPACVRLWYTGFRDKGIAAAVEAFTATYCSRELLAQEFEQVRVAAISDESLSIRSNTTLQEVTATYKKEETGMDIVIRLPTCYPLKAVELECTRRMGVSETLLRKWLLSMTAFLRNQNGAVAEAVLMWKRNVDREFEGVEECPICYSILHTSNHSLPKLACKTCKHKFHSACLYKWFSSSHKSTCPLCQTPF